MPDVTRDLWPDDISVDVPSPAMILNEQADVLAVRTQGFIQPELLADEAGGAARLFFDLVVPAAQGFRRRILIVRSQIGAAYPALVTARSLEGYKTEWSYAPSLGATVSEMLFSRIASTPEEFISIISYVFRSYKVRTTILSLLAKANESRVALPRLLLNQPISPGDVMQDEIETLPNNPGDGT